MISDSPPSPDPSASSGDASHFPVAFEPTGAVSQLSALIEDLSLGGDLQAVVVLAAEGNGWRPEDLAPLLRREGTPPLLGGIFPAVIHGSTLVERGTVLIGLRGLDLEICVIPDLNALEGFEVPAPRSPQSHYLTFADGLSPGVSELVEEFQYQIGPRGTFIGGGTGSGTFQALPSVITPQGLMTGAAVLCRFEASSVVEVSHGWKVASDVLRVTDSSGVLIRSLDHRPAFTVYQEALAELFGISITPGSFARTAALHPLGIQRLGQEVLVRDPIAVEADGSIRCVGRIHEGSFLRILSADPSELGGAAVESRNRLDKRCPPQPTGLLDLSFDCVSRRFILGKGIACEIEALSERCRLVGALSLGEIAHPSSHRVEFLNKSTVLARLQPVA